MGTVSENAPASDRGAHENVRMQGSEPHPQTPSNNKGYEDRRNAAACFKNPRKKEDWQPEFCGVVVVENLPDGTKAWVNVKERTARNGETYLTVTLKPFKR